MQQKSTMTTGTNRSFGIVFFIFFIIISLWPLTHEGEIRIWSTILAFIFLFLGLINSKLLTPLNLLWMKFGLLLGAIIAPIVMGIVFFAVVFPTGFFMKILGKDLLKKKYNKKENSYWITREKNKSTMKQQF